MRSEIMAIYGIDNLGNGIFNVRNIPNFEPVRKAIIKRIEFLFPGLQFDQNRIEILPSYRSTDDEWGYSVFVDKKISFSVYLVDYEESIFFVIMNRIKSFFSFFLHRFHIKK